jgi:hypothetical protein
MRRSSFAAAILLAGSLLTGLGFCALLPVFEGFDEIAHYSYIEQIAQTGTWPRLTDPLSREVEDVLRRAPSAVSSFTYRSFFHSGAVQNGADALHGARDPTRPWVPGTRSNWEGQHPPLYYALLAPIWLASDDWSLYTQMLLLRSISYLFAWGSLVIVTVSITRKTQPPARDILVLGPALWPVLWPMWFPEMARLGNDSLVSLLLALSWITIRRALGARGSTADFALLGAICGLAVLAKATALPFVAAVGLFLIWRIWRSDAPARRLAFLQLLTFCVVTTAVSAWMFIDNILNYGAPLVTADGAALAAKGGLLKGLRENLSFGLIFNGLVSVIRSFSWTGTWSLVFVPRLFELPIIILTVLVLTGWLVSAAKAKKLSEPDAVSIFALVLFFIGLLHHTFVYIALLGASGPGAYYLHQLAPLLATFAAAGLNEVARRRWLRPAVCVLAVYPLVFLPAVTAFLLLYFGGCLPDAVGDRRYSLAMITPCSGGISEVITNLSILGAPALAIPLYLAGWLAMLIGVLIVLRVWSRNRMTTGEAYVRGAGASNRPRTFSAGSAT